MKLVLMVLAFVSLVFLSFLATSVVFYWLGLFGKYIFHSNMEWTFLHGVFFALGYWLVLGIVRKDKE